MKPKSNLTQFTAWTVLLALSASSGSAAALKWSGARNPAKISAGDGVTKLGTKIGKFITLSNNAEKNTKTLYKAMAKMFKDFPPSAAK